MRREVKYKAGTILTDGKHLIKIGSAHRPTWTMENNHGSKWTEYTECVTYPKDLFINGIKTVQDKYSNSIPGLWFQEGYHLWSFFIIDKKLLNSDVLNKLNV